MPRLLGLAQVLDQLLDHAHVDLLHHAERFGALDELAGQHDVAVVVAHAHQDLVSAPCAVGQAHDRLAVEHQAIVVEHVAQLVRPMHAAVRAAQALRVLVVAARSGCGRRPWPGTSRYRRWTAAPATSLPWNGYSAMPIEAVRLRHALLAGGLEAVVAQRFEQRARRPWHGVAAQRFGQVNREFVAAQAEHLPVELLDRFLAARRSRRR